jgi:pimeloyl-ACP methyl ester carboxylesterase
VSTSSAHRLQRAVFSVAVTGIGILLVWRDRLLRRIPPGRGGGIAERVAIYSGRSCLDARFVRPESEVKAAVLICHGIGEIVEHWIRAQELLAEHGIASLVFNYSGCGRSTGWMSASQCEQDALVACAWLRARMPGVRVTLLGFSLGTGVAAAVASRAAPARLILCAGYPDFREAAKCFGMPIRGMVQDVWRSEETLAACTLPVVVVHGGRDRLFPVSMSERLAKSSGGELVVLPGMGHADLHAKARIEDWRPIIERIVV